MLPAIAYAGVVAGFWWREQWRSNPCSLGRESANWPAVGREPRFPVIQAFVAVVAVLIVVANLTADLVAMLADPRLREAAAYGSAAYERARRFHSSRTRRPALHQTGAFLQEEVGSSDPAFEAHPSEAAWPQVSAGGWVGFLIVAVLLRVAAIRSFAGGRPDKQVLRDRLRRRCCSAGAGTIRSAPISSGAICWRGWSRGRG